MYNHHLRICSEMDKRVIPNLTFIRYIGDIQEKKHLKDIIGVSTSEEIRALLEIIVNCLEGRLAGKIIDFKRLEKYKGKLLNICNIQQDIDSKKNLLSINIRAVQLILTAAAYFIHSLS